MSLRVLITNHRLAERSGSEVYTHDLALALLRRGHSPIAYSSVLGDVAADLDRATVPVVDDLASLQVEPDLIHGHHHLDTMCAVLRFPRTPAVYVCHGWAPWEERPPVFPSIRRYIAVDDLCRERLETTPGIDPARIRTVYNAVDLSRFQPRATLPARPRTAVIYSNYASAPPFLDAIRSACRAHGIDRLDVVGRAAGTSVAAPEHMLPQYDVVFAKARCALEAMAVGCAVVVADYAGLGGMVTPENVEPMRRLNFGVRTMQSAVVTAANVTEELARYDAGHSAEVSAYIRQHADAADAISRVEAVYREALAEPIDWSAEAGRHACNAAAGYLRSLVPVFNDRTGQAPAHEGQGPLARHLLAKAESELAHTRTTLAVTADTLRDMQHTVHVTTQHLMAATHELAAVRSSTTWLLFEPYRRLRGWFRGSTPPIPPSHA